MNKLMSYINYTYQPPPPNAFRLPKEVCVQFILYSKKFVSVKEVVLFGSGARGNYKPGSAIDLAIMNPGFEQRQYLSIINEFEESDLPYFTDLLYFHKLKNEALKEQILTYGQLIYTTP